jgi:hypothetical protein
MPCCQAKKTVDDILAMAAMKGSLSEEQVAAIRAIDRPAEQTQNDMAEHADFLAGFDDEGAQQ